jgi:hypothetical protein
MSAPISGASTAPTASASFDASPTALSPEERMLALVIYSQASQMSEAKTSIDVTSEQLERLRDQVKKALDEAREAKKDSGFWGGLAKLFGKDLASIAGAIAAVAAVIASGGAAAAILAVVAAAASFAAEHAKELGIPVEVAVVIAVAAAVAGLCCGDAKGLFKVSKAVADAAKGVKAGATAATFALEAGGATCGAAAAGYDHLAAYRQADAHGAEGQEDLASADIDAALERFSAAVEYQSNALEVASSTQQQTAAGNFAILNNWGGVV